MASLVLLANLLAALLKASVIRGRAYRFAAQFREQPLRILVAHFQAERGHQQQHEHPGDHDYGIVFATRIRGGIIDPMANGAV